MSMIATYTAEGQILIAHDGIARTGWVETDLTYDPASADPQQAVTEALTTAGYEVVGDWDAVHGEPMASVRISDGLITTTDAAELAGVSASTLRAYSARGQAPATAYRGLYRRGEIEQWMATRPGRGARTDLRDRVRHGTQVMLLGDGSEYGIDPYDEDYAAQVARSEQIEALASEIIAERGWLADSDAEQLIGLLGDTVGRGQPDAPTWREDTKPWLDREAELIQAVRARLLA